MKVQKMDCLKEDRVVQAEMVRRMDGPEDGSTGSGIEWRFFDLRIFGIFEKALKKNNNNNKRSQITNHLPKSFILNLNSYPIT